MNCVIAEKKIHAHLMVGHCQKLKNVVEVCLKPYDSRSHRKDVRADLDVMIL